MLIDWFTVAAQVVNFAILVWLLKRFLYRPILDAVDAREKRIAAELAAADAKRAEADAARAEFLRKSAAFDEARAAMMNQAADDAKTERARLIDEARAAVAAATNKQVEALRSEAESLGRDIGRRIQQEIFAVARSALGDLATTTLEERIADVFVRRLHDLDAPTKAAIADALGAAKEPAVVRSAFELPAAQQTAIANALTEAFSPSVGVRFETAPNLIGGIEVTTTEYRVGWNIADYLASIETRVAEVLNAHSKPTATKSAPELPHR